MPLFAVIGFDVPPHSMALRDAHRAEHREYYLRHDAPVRFAGAMYDGHDNQCGSVLIFEARDAAEVQAWFDREPFHRNGVYSQLVIREWRPSLNRLPPMPDWPAGVTPVGTAVAPREET